MDLLERVVIGSADDLSHDDQGSKIQIIDWTLTAAATVLFSLRLYAKIVREKVMWWDDCLLAASLVSITLPHYLRPMATQCLILLADSAHS